MGVKGAGVHGDGHVRAATFRCEQAEESEHSARVECGVVLFRTLIIPLNVNQTRRETCESFECYSALLNGLTAHKLCSD
jgi:hypothetical protein